MSLSLSHRIEHGTKCVEKEYNIKLYISQQVHQWCSGDRDGMYHISTWDTSNITDMKWLFANYRTYSPS